MLKKKETASPVEAEVPVPVPFEADKEDYAYREERGLLQKGE